MQSLTTRTTITLPTHLLQQAKFFAIEQKKSVNDILIQGLIHQLSRSISVSKPKKSLLSMAGSVKAKNPIPVEKLRDFIDYSS